MEVLAGDIGGTKTILAIAEVRGTRVRLLQERRFVSLDYADLATMTREFLAEVARPLPSRSGFGVAGPVVRGRARITKLPWVLEEARLARELGMDRVRLVNDFVAVARGIEALEPNDLVELNHGEPDPSGPIAILGAGTGLGEAVSLEMGGHRVVVPSEGGHADFGARDELEFALLLWLKAKYRRVSYDRILSGPGLADIYRFLRDTGRGVEVEEVRDAMAQASDPAPVVTGFAERGDALCNTALDCFVSIYGAEAGNMAMRAVATGGVYIGGGIAPRLVSRLQTGEFRRSFVMKGRLSAMVQSIPAFLIVNSKVGLLGAAVLAASAEQT